MKNQYTITLYQDSEGNFAYDVYKGEPDMSVSLDSEDATLEELDGGVCDGELKDVFGMIGDVILKEETEWLCIECGKKKEEYEAMFCDKCFKENLLKYMKVEDIKNVKSVEEARQFAIDWQKWSSEQKMYTSELVEWQEALESLALDWGLSEEFKENGII